MERKRRGDGSFVAQGLGRRYVALGWGQAKTNPTLRSLMYLKPLLNLPKSFPPCDLPARNGLRDFRLWGAVTRESRLTKEEAFGPRKVSGVLQSFFSFLESGRESPKSVRSKMSLLLTPFSLVLGRSPNRSTSINKRKRDRDREREWCVISCLCYEDEPTFALASHFILDVCPNPSNPIICNHSRVSCCLKSLGEGGRGGGELHVKDYWFPSTSS